jgi:hypothetical protein
MQYIGYDRIFELICNYGPKLNFEMSRSNYDIYKLEKKNNIIEEQNKMNLFAKHFSIAVPDKIAINKLSKYLGTKETILELNAYLGLWSALLKNKGCNMVATDEHYHKTYTKFYPVENMYYANAIEKYKPNTLFLLANEQHFLSKYIDTILDIPNCDRIVIICEKTYMDELSEKISGNTKHIISRLEAKKDPNVWMIKQEIRIPQWLNHDYKVYCLEKI